MKILLVSNYFYIFGGAERAFFNTSKVLKEHGHKVISFAMRSPKNLPSGYSEYFIPEIDLSDRSDPIRNILQGPIQVYNRQARIKLGLLIKKEKPDIVHIHNIGRRITLSIIDATEKYQIPVVHTLHDYKPICSINNFYRDDKICELCIHQRYYNVLSHKCNHNSYTASFFDMVEKYLNFARKTYSKIDLLISPSEFLKKKLVEDGFDKNQIVILRNFVEYYKNRSTVSKEKYVLYFSRLDHGKGTLTLIETVKKMKEVHLKIAGDGPLENFLRQQAAGYSNIEFIGRLGGQPLNNALDGALFTIVPSEWYENAPMTVLESFAHGKPVIGANIGGIPENIEDRKSGLLFEPGSSEDLHKKILYLYNHPDLIKQMGAHAQKTVREQYSSERYYRKLIKIYNDAREKNENRTNC